MDEEDIPRHITVLINHEDRLLQLEHEVGLLEKRMPKNRIGRVVWWIDALWIVGVVIMGGASVFLVERPLLGGLLAGCAFGGLLTKTATNIIKTASLGPRQHKSLLVDDWR